MLVVDYIGKNKKMKYVYVFDDGERKEGNFENDVKYGARTIRSVVRVRDYVRNCKYVYSLSELVFINGES